MSDYGNYNNSYENYLDSYNNHWGIGPVSSYKITMSSDGFEKDTVVDYIAEILPKNEDLRSFFGKKRSIENIVEDRAMYEDTTDAFIFLPKENVYDIRLLLDKEKDTTNLSERCLLPYVDSHLEAWLKEQKLFLERLNPRQKTALGAYTQHGDRLLNWVLRGTLKANCRSIIENIIHVKEVPFKYAVFDKYDYMVRKGLDVPPRQKLLDKTGYIDDYAIVQILYKNIDWFSQRDNLIPFIVILLHDITDIIYVAPKPMHEMMLYRGVKSEHNNNLQFTNLDFLSTSLNPYATVMFTNPLEADVFAMVYEITVGPDIPCLFLQEYSKFKSSEFEVLLPPGVHFTMEKQIRVKTQVQHDLLDDDIEADAYLHRLKDKYASKRRVLIIRGKTMGINRDALSSRYIHSSWRTIQSRRKELTRRGQTKRAAIAEAPILKKPARLLQENRSQTSRFTSRPGGETRRSREKRKTLSRMKSRKMKAGSRSRGVNSRGILEEIEYEPENNNQ